MKKKHMLICIVICIFTLGAVASIVLNLTWFNRSSDKVIYVGLSAREGDSVVARSVKQGADLFFDEFNESQRLPRVRIMTKPVDDETDAVDVFSIIGSAIGTEKDSILPTVNIYPHQPVTGEGRTDVVSTVFSLTHQIRFMANYNRNVLGHKLLTVVHQDTDEGRSAVNLIKTVYERFGTRVYLTRTISLDEPQHSVESLVGELKQRKDLGSIIIVASAGLTAEFVVAVRNEKMKTPIVGMDVLASQEFKDALGRLIRPQQNIEDFTHNLMVASPLLFDTAGEQVQGFRQRYRTRFGVPPDWVAAYAYDAAKMVAMGLLAESGAGGGSGKNETAIETGSVSYYQSRVSRHFKMLLNGDQKYDSVTHSSVSSLEDSVGHPVQVGVYNGESIIAAPTQLEPLRVGVKVDYLDEIKNGKMLYVNNRFMYKTNVIYTGVELIDVVDIDWDEKYAELDLHIWFRFSGKFNPEDVELLNSLETIDLGAPIKHIENEYSLHRIRAKFALDSLSVKRPYGNHHLGISFVHQSLNKNNVIYVVDELGYDFDKVIGIKQQVESLYSLSQKYNQKVTRAWIAQSLTSTSSLGRPQYIGHGTIDPDFSRIDYNLMIKKNRIDIHSLVPVEYLVYFGVFGLVGSVVGRELDRRLRGNFWRSTAWVLYLVFWPLLLLSVGNILVDVAIDKAMAEDSIDMLIMAYDIAWWVLLSALLVMAADRFAWTPLEEKSQRKIPNIIRVFASFIIHTLTFFAVVAFVFDQTLTSFLATGGLLVMIVGLAIQNNISNVFAGIIINLAKPFSIGNYLKIEGLGSAQVVDITWRTVRVVDLENNMISIPNGQMADSIIVNHSQGFCRVNQSVFVPIEHALERVDGLISSALDKTKGIDSEQGSSWSYIGITEYEGIRCARYDVVFSTKGFEPEDETQKALWLALEGVFRAEGMTFKGDFSFGDEASS